jgi:hypothetical protein
MYVFGSATPISYESTELVVSTVQTLSPLLRSGTITYAMCYAGVSVTFLRQYTICPRM